MSNLLFWMSRRRVVTALMAAAYFVAVVVSHGVVQNLAYWLQRTFTRDLWAPAVAMLAFAAAAWLAWRAARAPRGESPPRSVAAAWWGSLVLAGVASLTLLATNMETVHFLQYGLLAIPVLALTGRTGLTVLLVGILGTFDELYQWSVLHPGWAVRFDANDVVLNTIGAGLGCAAAAVFGRVRPAPSPDGRALAATWAPLLSIALLLGAGAPALAASGRLAVYREGWCPHVWLTLSRARRPQARWQTPERARAHFVLHPGAALAICLLLTAGFCALDDRWRPVVDQSSTS